MEKETSIVVAGVNVDPKNPPLQEDLIKMALISHKHESNPNAKKDINLEIKNSGLYPGVTAKVETGKSGSESAKAN